MGKIWEAVDKNRTRKQKLENRNRIRKPREYYEVGINVGSPIKYIPENYLIDNRCRVC